MVWYLGVWAEGPIFEWQDKSGSYADPDTPLPFSRWLPGPKVEDTANIPTLAIHKQGGPLPDAFWIRDAGVVSERFKAIVDDIEPNTHQFFPVTLKRKDGTPCPGKYFIFHPTRYAPCVLLSKSGVRSKVIVKRGERKGLPNYHIHYDEYVISRPSYGDRKIFGSLFIMRDGIFVVDEFMDRIEGDKLQYFMKYRVKELDEPWVFEEEAPDLAAFLKDRPDIAATYKLEAF